MKRLIALTALCLTLPAAHAQLFLSSNLVNFYDTPVNSYGKQTNVYVQNLNTGAVQVTVTNTCYGDFDVTNECSTTLGQNQACNIEIRFQPRMFGQQSCNITVNDSAGDSGFIDVSGRGVR
jgi:hypothetical protein